MGEEFWAKGTNIQEGPGVNVARIQHNGRNFEYMSGEDPALGSALLPRVVAGIQTNVMAIVKRASNAALACCARNFGPAQPSTLTARPRP